MLKLSMNNCLLTVKTKKVDKTVEKDMDGEIIHRGISQRSFSRKSFTIADDMRSGRRRN